MPMGPTRLVLATLAVAAVSGDMARAGEQGVAALVKAYPEQLDRVEGNALIWKDGTRMAVSDGLANKSLEQRLEAGDIRDMFSMRYPIGETALPPLRDLDPGRVRPQELFDKLYGNCLTGDMAGRLATVIWLPSKVGAKLKFAAGNGAAARLQMVSNELDRLPGTFLKYLHPSAGTYNCRSIGGAQRASPHGYGIAIDLATSHAHYWLWTKPGRDGVRAYRNQIPWEIVRIFETNGFIWGGKWHHFDTMHFEYRPEMLIDGQD
jgi:hypothetical protein